MRLSLRSAVFERLKKTLMVWVAVYPSVLVVLLLVGDVLQDWPFTLRVLGATALIVPIVANITEPAVKAAVAAIEREWTRTVLRLASNCIDKCKCWANIRARRACDD